jgi:hypothetical protein
VKKHSTVLVARNWRHVAAPFFLVFSLDTHKVVTRVIALREDGDFKPLQV